jgi:hypothetical protein
MILSIQLLLRNISKQLKLNKYLKNVNYIIIIIIMNEIIDTHRNCLEKVKPIITKEDWENSLNNYGLPPRVFHLIDLKIDDNITYADLLSFLSTHLTKPIVYCEIGVSMLKTFFQLANSFTKSKLFAFELNDINPTVEKVFDVVDTSNPDIKKYKYQDNSITYYKGNVLKEESLKGFKETVGEKVNVYFTDHHVSPEALIIEYNVLINQILDDNFILYYDDMDGGHYGHDAVFREIAKREKMKNKNVTAAYIYVNGWLGQHERTHCNGIITTLNLNELLKGRNIKITYI